MTGYHLIPNFNPKFYKGSLSDYDSEDDDDTIEQLSKIESDSLTDSIVSAMVDDNIKKDNAKSVVMKLKGAEAMEARR
mgnify:CR=1 FL=1